jgi:hypothetical protein
LPVWHFASGIVDYPNLVILADRRAGTRQHAFFIVVESGHVEQPLARPVDFLKTAAELLLHAPAQFWRNRIGWAQR